MTATSVSGNPSKQEQLVGRRAPNGETCSVFLSSSAAPSHQKNAIKTDARIIALPCFSN